MNWRYTIRLRDRVQRMDWEHAISTGSVAPLDAARIAQPAVPTTAYSRAPLFKR